MNSFFDQIYCINLDHRTDRWEHCEAEFARLNLTVQRVAATYIPPVAVHQRFSAAELACTISHLRVLEDITKNGFDKVLVLEDDVVFSDSVESQFRELISILPEDWDMVYLGGTHMEPPITVSESLVRVSKTLAASSLAIRGSMAQHLLDHFNHDSPIIDLYYSQFQKHHQCFAPRVPMAWQREGWSDLQLKHVDYTDLLRPLHAQEVYRKSPAVNLISNRAKPTLLHSSRRDNVELNEFSFAIWGLCNGRTSVAQIVEQIRAAYSGDAAQIEQDIFETLRIMKERDLIQQCV